MIGIGNRIGRPSGINWSSWWTSILASPNSDLVQWNSIDAITLSGAAVSTFGSGQKTLSLITKYKGERISGYRTVSQVQFFNITLINIVSVTINQWRINGLATYDLVSSENITALVSAGAGIKSITLATPMVLIEGDYVGLTWVGTAAVEVSYVTAAAANSMRYKVVVPSNPEAWDSATGVAYKHQIYCLAQAPMIVGVGDSMMESYPLHTSMVDVTRTTVDVSKSWLYKLYDADNRFIYQDCGIGNTTSTQISSVFNRDVVLKKPKLVVINGGVNDIAGGVITKATFLSNWTSMLDACLANDIIPIVWKIMPCDNLDNTEMATRDEWNADLVTLFNTYSIKGKKIIDWDSILGVNRVGGAAGNLWDINPTYAQGDGTHLNEAGQALIASTVLTLFS